MERTLYRQRFMKLISQILFSVLVFYKANAQNLPSLLLEKNINATFSITAYDEEAQEWGIAVATNNIYVGNSTVYIEPGVGAFSVIADTEPAYALNGFKNLKDGMSIKDAIELTKNKDEEWFYRQVAGLDKNGNAFAFTGQALEYWQGKSAHLVGKSFVVMGNQLADGVLEAMAKTFTESTGTLAERLVKSITAGQNAGGQIQGKQSAALAVKGTQNEWYNQIDLRVDDSKTPFEDLQKLLNYHYGRIRLNQAVSAIRKKNIEKGTILLAEAQKMLEGWNGIYPKISIAFLMLNDEKNAIAYIKKGLKENPNWKEYLPVFYCLKNQPEIAALLNEKQFTDKDWTSATATLLTLGREKEALEILSKKPSSPLYLVFAKAYQKQEKNNLAKEYASKAVKLDTANAEAKLILQQ
ncbi:DUF1028 domain-containing protein [Flavobacterium foetidum]|uniref:DUF1028 domain-containing protein n=1 Tax=Flavobacterium foetidum TaxID=2026681 RepID=UPI001074D351|nr:DUF1028 domain-containing protein [Flavobacterium foetidum]KAF2517147.1 DUF1028 domain-containing protein [Flavobacterium foetidum]